MPLSAGQQFAGYEILGEIGRGGMGAVYQARQVSLQRLIALKILPPHLADEPGFLARFQSEAVATASLNHPNIVQVYAAGESGGLEYIVMEYVEGETIQHRLRRCGRLPLTEALDIAYHVATALDHAWQQARLVHRDVKPDNIFLAQNGTVKLGDFGLAKIFREGTSSVTVTGHVLGSPHFISPEQARGQRDLDHRADIYSLGCTLHYMMTGRTVFEAPDFVSILLKQVSEPPAPLRTLLPNSPAAVNRLLARLLEKNREDRPQSYAELLEELAHTRGDAAVWEAGDEGHRKRMVVAEDRSSRSPWIYVAALLVALVVLAGFFYRQRQDQGPADANVLRLTDPSDRRDFVQAIGRLPAAGRVERVMARMQELNPDFAGREKYAVEDGVVTELSFSSVGVKNLWPLAALKHLRVLRCPGDVANQRRSDLADLAPLAELPELEEIDVRWTNVEDLRPLARLPLKVLRLNDTRVRDLGPLRGVPLQTLEGDPRLLRGAIDLLKSWPQLESINGVAPREFLSRRLKARPDR